MAYAISDACIQCGACADACPASAISEGDGKYVIDADTCVECGACADTCPVGAPDKPPVLFYFSESAVRSAFSISATAPAGRAFSA